jgi:hypothetical protein
MQRFYCFWSLRSRNPKLGFLINNLKICHPKKESNTPPSINHSSSIDRLHRFSLLTNNDLRYLHRWTKPWILFISMNLNYIIQRYNVTALPLSFPTIDWKHILSFTNDFYNLEIMIYVIYLWIYQFKTCVSFLFPNNEKLWSASRAKSLQSFPLQFLASSSPSSFTSNWQNHLHLGHPTSLFPLNFNSNTLLCLKPAYDTASLVV